MTPEAQRIAIEEAAGIDRDWLGSLDAMHEAEKVLNDSQKAIYFEAICVVLGIPEGLLSDITSSQMFNILSATASQRAEAFLRTLNLWDDSK